jgi:hypothetical protein
LEITVDHSENGRLVVTMTAAFSARSPITWNALGPDGRHPQQLALLPDGSRFEGTALSVHGVTLRSRYRV